MRRTTNPSRAVGSALLTLGAAAAFSLAESTGPAKGVLLEDPGAGTFEGKSPEQLDKTLLAVRARYEKAGEKARPVLEEAYLRIAAARVRSMPPADGDPARSAVLNTLQFLRESLASTMGRPQKGQNRDACSWDSRRVLAAGSYNGCVEVARAFQDLLRAALPGVSTRYVSSFDVDAAAAGDWRRGKDPAGHALVEVLLPGGGSTLVDPGVFLGAGRVTDVMLQGAHGPDPNRKGIVLQPQGQRVDVHIARKDGRYEISRYPSNNVFNEHALLSRETFADLRAVNKSLSPLYPPPTFDSLEALGALRREEADGSYSRDGKRFIIFEKRDSCPYRRQRGPGGSNEATLKAIERWAQGGLPASR